MASCQAHSDPKYRLELPSAISSTTVASLESIVALTLFEELVLGTSPLYEMVVIFTSEQCESRLDSRD